MTPRQQLMELIEAYATAKGTDNLKLQALAAQALAGWIQAHDIIAPVEVPEAIKQQVEGLTK
jgi:hypothetical protein